MKRKYSFIKYKVVALVIFGFNDTNENYKNKKNDLECFANRHNKCNNIKVKFLAFADYY